LIGFPGKELVILCQSAEHRHSEENYFALLCVLSLAGSALARSDRRLFSIFFFPLDGGDVLGLSIRLAA
jgi:hypothetical protein